MAVMRVPKKIAAWWIWPTGPPRWDNPWGSPTWQRRTQVFYVDTTRRGKTRGDYVNIADIQWIGLREKIAGKPHIYWENIWFPVQIFPWKPIHWDIEQRAIFKQIEYGWIYGWYFMGSSFREATPGSDWLELPIPYMFKAYLCFRPSEYPSKIWPEKWYSRTSMYWILEISHWFMSVKTVGLPYSIYSRMIGWWPPIHSNFMVNHQHGVWGLTIHKLPGTWHTRQPQQPHPWLKWFKSHLDASHQAGYGPTPSDWIPWLGELPQL